MLEPNMFFIALIAGFVAQIINGSLGMGYGVSLSLFLISVGIPPVVASASIHVSEVFTSAAGGLAHYKLRNIQRALFQKLALSGVVGGIAGALVLTRAPEPIIKPFIAVYLLLMGAVIVYKAFRQAESKQVTTHIVPLGVIGGFLDAIGGGGWGPIVTSTLLARGHSPRKSIGSVSLASFFVTLAIALTLLTTVSIVSQIEIVAGLIIGGVAASPIAVFLNRKLPTRALMGLVGAFILALSIRAIVSVLGG